jgi:hypothetical protein
VGGWLGAVGAAGAGAGAGTGVGALGAWGRGLGDGQPLSSSAMAPTHALHAPTRTTVFNERYS